MIIILLHNVMPNSQEMTNDILTHPEFIRNYSLLQDIGVIEYINSMNREVQNYRNLVNGALDILNSTTINDIIDATVRQISDRLLPSFIAFLWKPLQNREDITIRSYKNYKPSDLNIRIDSLSVYEPLFQKYPYPLEYKFIASELGHMNLNETLDAIQPALIIPILGPSGLSGMVLLGPKILEGDFTKAELTHIRELMSFVSQAIQNYLHYEMTLRDDKTGLYNNGFFLGRLAEEISRAKRTGDITSVIMMDVDNFKIFNDTYGHLAGDRVLENLAITIKQGARTEDIPSRFGGEEFSILLPDTGREQAWIVAERLRTNVEEMKIQWEPQLPKVTISLGVFSFEGKSSFSADEIIRNTDEALYISKELGRNRTTAWGSGLFDKIQRMESSTREKTG